MFLCQRYNTICIKIHVCDLYKITVVCIHAIQRSCSHVYSILNFMWFCVCFFFDTKYFSVALVREWNIKKSKLSNLI